MKELNITLNSSKIVLGLGLAAIFLVIANIAGLVVEYGLSHPNFFDYIDFFHLVRLDDEQNLPTYFSSLLLFACSVLAFVLGLSRKKNSEKGVFYWIGMAALFLFMSVDESVSIHEMFTGILQFIQVTSEYQGMSWVVPYGIGSAFLFLVYLKFLFGLSAKPRRLFFAAGAVYGVGALGMEIIGAKYFVEFGEVSLLYEFLGMCEESLEMAGAILFIYALLRSIEVEITTVSLQVPPDL